MKLIIFGPPGTGKGTEAKLLSEKLGLKHISTGVIFRDEYKRKTKMGIEAHDKYWGAGNLVPDNVTTELVKKNLPAENFILDGYPRNVAQAKALEEFSKIDKVIYLDSDEGVAVERLLRRAKIEGRTDDTPEVIKKRFQVYKKQTAPLLEFYREKLVRINGNPSIQEVFKEILSKLNLK